jgi:hypothetical protein
MRNLKELATPENIGKKFVEILKDWLTPEEFARVCLKNYVSNNPTVCASHDYCDANMAMVAAMTWYALDPDPFVSGEQSALDLWEASWKHAKTIMTCVRQPIDYKSQPTLERNPIDPTEEKTWCISTSHITAQDGKLSGSESAPGHRATHDGKFGDLFYVRQLHCSSYDPDYTEQVEFGFSAAFINILRKAANAGVCWIWFDCDGEEIDGWPTFDW